MPTKQSTKYTKHKVESHCLGSGWKLLDIAYCGKAIITYQYRPEQTKGDMTPLNFIHYSRCAECAAKLWHQRRLDRHGQKWRRGSGSPY